jgi:nucleoside-diphosphate-sugar epimerase
MRVLVMGGTRFNGLALVYELMKHGHEVTVFNRGQSEAALPYGVKRLYGDRNEHQQLTDELRKHDFDCVQDISGYTLADIQPLYEAFKGRIGHYIFAGSTVIYANTKVLPIRETHPLDEGPNQGDYGKNKILAERWLFEKWRSERFPATVMSFSMVFGPHNNIVEREQRAFMRVLKGRPALIPGDGTTMGQIGHVDDEATALRMAMCNPNTFAKRYNVTGKDYFTDEGYLETVANVVGVQQERINVPASLIDDVLSGQVSLEGKTVQIREPRQAVQAANPSNMRFVTGMVQRLNPAVRRWNDNTVFAIDAMREDFGFTPAYTFESAVAQTYEWFRREGLEKEREFDFGWEDTLIEMIRRS